MQCGLVLLLQFDVQILSTKLADHWKYMIQKPKADLSTMVIAPMPGMVKSVNAKVGDEAWQPYIAEYIISGVDSLLLTCSVYDTFISYIAVLIFVLFEKKRKDLH